MSDHTSQLSLSFAFEAQGPYEPSEIVVPAIDGEPLAAIAGGRFPGLSRRTVAPPSRHWLGESSYGEDGRIVVLDGGCSIAECCGVMARMTFEADTVRWHDFAARGRPPIPEGLDFTFDRSQYEAAVAALVS